MAGTNSETRKAPSTMRVASLAALASLLQFSAAQSCIPLSGSTQCPAFSNASISTDRSLTGLFPFLSFVSSREDFDTRLRDYVQSSYVQTKFQNLLGCSNVDLNNTTNYYARYTLSTICNSIVQNSIEPCNLTGNAATPLCATACAEQAISEEEIAVNNNLCHEPNDDYMSVIRADYTTCSLPAQALTGGCIGAEQNEQEECGFSTNLQGLCNYCRGSTSNSTDSCCVASNVTSRCTDVTLPSIASMPPLFPSSTSTSSSATSSPSASASASSTAAPAASSNNGLSGGAIAGIVVGSIVGAALLLGLLVLCCVAFRRRRRSQTGSVFNQPSPKRTPQPGMAYAPVQDVPAPGGRVARMTALEAESSDEKGRVNPVLAAERRGFGESSDSDPYAESPTRGAPVTQRRTGSLSSNSALNVLGSDEVSPSNNQYSSPGDVTSGQSEMLPFFKDYYSQDEIHPGDKVATLWAYQPRAGDEFELERGDMIRVVNIWDDGWATGVRLDERAEDYDGKHKVQRDSGVSNGTGRRESPTPQGDVKAFPLVCVCLPEHWKKTIETDSSTETTSPSSQGHPLSFGNF